ncbi:ATP synthase d subunit [Malassezia sp. CBS 17886]|nr:ATP synthase d subunit [Malassezia sp. CBS 17886]
MASKAVAFDFSKVLASGIGKETAATLGAFRKRTEEAKRAVVALKEQPTTVDIAHYKSVLKNQSVVSQAEKILADFKPATYDTSAQIKAIDSFEAVAAEEASKKIEAELKDLKETLSNIEGARPFGEITTTDILAARPEIGKTIEEMTRKGKWTLPGYEEKFGSLAMS